MPSVLIVGGGLTGLLTATILKRAGYQVVVVDKGRGIGGRLASRRLRDDQNREGVFDYGAQYFTVTNPLFQPWVQEWLTADIIKPWSDSFSSDTGDIKGAGKVAYRGVQSNRSLAQYLAQDLEVYLQTQVTNFSWQDDRWQVFTTTDTTFKADILILTAPVPQALSLLANSEIRIPSEQKQALEAIAYYPCIALLALLEKPSLIPEPGGLFLSGETLAWIACNYQKGISPQGYGVTLHTTPKFSQNYWEENAEIITEKMLTAAGKWLGSPVLQTHLHRWRYSLVSAPYHYPFEFLPQPGPLFLAGDGFVAGKIEGAALSAIALADYVCQNHPS